MISGPGSKIRSLEKLAYLFLIPTVMGASAFTLYRKNVLQAGERAAKLKEIEERYLGANPDNMVKLQNFKKRVFAIGMIDDLGVPNRETEEHKEAISKNSAMIRDFLKEISPEQLVLEMCEERYEDEM